MDIERLERKYKEAQKVVSEALDKYGAENLRLAWTGGKDSTLMLHIVSDVCAQIGCDLPEAFCIDEGDMFDEIRDFLSEQSPRYKVSLEVIRNDNVFHAAGGTLGAVVNISDLDLGNRRELARLGYEEEGFAFEPESFVGNHLMKTVTLSRYIEATGLRGFFEGIRWDEQGSRSKEVYFSPRPATDYCPEHVRVCPILHFTERDVWDATSHFGMPACSLYAQGYRSLGARATTQKASDLPAWEQDLENTSERGGRRQDKEHLMEKLRSLGYM